MWVVRIFSTHIRKGNIFKPPLHASALVMVESKFCYLQPDVIHYFLSSSRIEAANLVGLNPFCYISLVSRVITVESDLYIYRPYCWFHLLRMI